MHIRVDIKRNDTVKIITGRDKGKQGRVLRVSPDDKRILVEHVGVVKKHVRPNPQRNIKGGILEREASVDASNLMVVCSECGKPARVGHKKLDDGKKVRTCRRCNGILDK